MEYISIQVKSYWKAVKVGAKVCSEPPDASVREWNKFKVYRKVLIPWQRIWKNFVKTLVYGSKFFKYFQKILGRNNSVIYGFFGLQNGIFGKFYWFFSFANVWKRLNTCRFNGTAWWSLVPLNFFNCYGWNSFNFYENFRISSKKFTLSWHLVSILASAISA